MSTDSIRQVPGHAGDTGLPAPSMGGQRSGAAAGIFAVLLMGALVFLGAPAFEGAFDFQQPAESFGAAIEMHRQTLGLVNFLLGLIGVSLLWFVVGLSGTIRRAEGEPGTLSAAGRTAGVLWAFVWILYAALASSALELPDYYQNPEGARTAMPLAFHMLFSPIILLLPAVMMGTTALISLRAQVLPRWSGWVSVIFAILNLTASGLGSVFSGPAILLSIIFPLWIVMISIILFSRSHGR